MVYVSHDYESRVDNEAAIVARRDPTVYSDLSKPSRTGLNLVQLTGYEQNGYVFLEDFFSDQEVALFNAELQRMLADPLLPRCEESVTEPGSTAVRSIFSVHTLNEFFIRLARDRRLVDIGRQILGSEVYIHQSRANLKPGFEGKEFYWHSDFETWHVEDGMPRMRAVSCSIALTENNECNGPLMLIPGSHRHFISCVGATPKEHYKDSLKKQEYGTPDPASVRLLADKGGIVSIKGRAGSVVFFDCNTIHGSNSNISPYPRSNLFIVYNSVENQLQAPRGGLAPRPEFIATREDFTPVEPIEPEAYLAVAV